MYVCTLPQEKYPITIYILYIYFFLSHRPYALASKRLIDASPPSNQLLAPTVAASTKKKITPYRQCGTF